MSAPINMSLNEEFISKVKENYKDRFDAVKKVYPDMSEEQMMRLGILLENVNEQFSRSMGMKMLNEANGTTQQSDIANGIKTQYFDIITAVFPNLIAEKLFSVQPIRSRTAQIFYLKFLYGTNKGPVRKGDTIFSATEIAGYENRNYTSEVVEDEAAFSQAASGTEVTFTGNLGFVPVKPGTVTFTMDTVEIVDDGDGHLTGTGISTGTINYDSGAYSVTFTSAPAEGDATVNYEYDMTFAPSTIPSIELRVTDTTVTARPRKLKGVYSLDAGYDLKMSQGIDIDDALLEAAAQTLKNEVDAELIMTAYAQANMSVTWNDTYNNQTAEVSKRDFYEDFLDAVHRGASMIKQKTKRVLGNWMVCGKRAADILSFIGAPRFVGSGDTTSVGPHFLGTLDNRIAVYDDPFMDQDTFLIGFKGSTLLDAGLIYAPYLLFFATETVMLEDFLGRRGFATTYGKKMVNADMYVKGMIVRSTQEGANTTTETIGG